MIFNKMNSSRGRGQIGTVMLSAVLILCANSVYGSVFKDVPESHWGYSYINRVSEAKLMVGDTSGNFRPNDYIDKFDTARVLARAVGFKYSDKTQEEQAFIDNAHARNKNLLSSYARALDKWNPDAELEIAYLLEKEILIPDDLNQFVIKDSAGKHQLRALSREEAAVFLTRILGESESALSGSYEYDFTDDENISLSCKPYVYFLKEKGIVAGETGGKFNPKGAVTRASLSVLLDKTLDLEKRTGTGVTASSPSAPITTVPVTKVDTVAGKIEKLYPALNAVQIMTTEGSSKIYKTNAAASISIDNYVNEYADLKEGMAVIAIVIDGNISDLKAQSPRDAKPQASATIPEASAPTTSPAPAATEQPHIKFSLEGIVTGVSQKDLGHVIDIEVRLLTPRGEVVSTAYSFDAATDCVITRGEVNADFNGIHTGDIAKLTITNGRVSNIDLEEKDISITGGLLLAKKYDEDARVAILSVQSPGGRIYDFRTTATTYISRNGTGSVPWSNLRVGDKVELTSEYDRLIQLTATGEYSNVSGIIAEVNIAKTGSYLVVTDDTGKSSKYGFVSSVIDFNSLKIGNLIWLRLDSQEIESFSVIQSGDTTTAIGYVTAIRANTIVITDSKTSGNSVQKEIVFDSSTIFTDGRAGGASATIANVYQGMMINVTLANANSNLATAIMIVE